MWIDIASIVFVCVTANHLGLIKAIESVIKCYHLPIISCPKCFTFWSVLLYCSVGCGCVATTTLAISFLASYSAIWLELFEGFIDTLYMKCYEKIYPDTADDTASADADNGNPAGSVSELWQQK